jgi:RNA polymerase sigma factor (sigma-70 family)
MKTDQLKRQLFEEICNIYSKDLQKFIYSLTRKDQLAMEEIFQNTMVEALEGLNNLRKNDRMKTWIFTIAKAEARRYYSKQQKIVWSGYEDLSDSMAGNLIGGSSPEDFTKTLENREIVLSLLNRLSEEEQQIYILHYNYDMPLKEISEILHINYSTIRTIHVRGIYKFKEYAQKGLLLWIMMIALTNH